ncbi:MAG: hypothetical protein Q8N84_02235 [bacterium]|nr:hypothetical protein [bacterium]
MYKLLSAPLSSRKLIEYLLLFLLLAFVLSAAAYGGYWYGKKQQSTPPQTVSPKAKETTSQKATAETAGWKTYTGEAYTFKYPGDFTLTDSGDAVGLTFLGPTQKAQTELYDGVALSFSRSRSLSGKDLQSLATTLLDQELATGVSELVKGLEEVTVNGIKGYKYTLSGLGTFESIFLESDLKGGIFVQITNFVNADPTNQGFQKTVGKILSTFRFLDQEGSNAIQLEGLTLGDTISSPLIIKGTVRAGWMFEGVFPIRLLDNQRKEITRVLAEQVIPGDWTSGKERIAFKTTLTFSTKATSGYLVFRPDSGKELPEDEESFEIPVNFSQSTNEAAGWKTYKNDVTTFKKYQISYPPSWSVSKTQDESMDRLVISKGAYKINIFQPLGGIGGSQCFFPGDAGHSDEGPFVDFGSYTEFDILGRTFRRAKVLSGSTNAFAFCEKSSYGFGIPTSWGSISYETPATADTSVLAEMDSIVKTLKPL